MKDVYFTITGIRDIFEIEELWGKLYVKRRIGGGVNGRLFSEIITP